MPYHPSIPQSTDDPSNSQQDLLDNFTKINSDWLVNHIPLTSGINNGRHTQVNFPNVLSSDPNLASPASSLYTKTVGSATQLFFQNGPTFANVVQLTGLVVVNGYITNVTPGATTTVTTANNHGLSPGNLVTIQGVTGITGGINGGPFTLTVASGNTFTFALATGGAYVSGGSYTTNNTNQITNWGIITPWGLRFNLGFSLLGNNTINFAAPFQSKGFAAFVSPQSGLSTYSTNIPNNNQLQVSWATNQSFYFMVFGV